MRNLDKLSGLWRPFTQNHPSLFAAAGCFYLIVSVFPSTLFLLGLLRFLPVPQSQLSSAAAHIVPGPLLPLVDYVLKTFSEGDSLAILSLSAAATLWSAAKGVLSIMDGLNLVLDFPCKKGYVRRRVVAVIYFLLLSLGLSLTLCVLVFGQQLLLACLRWLPRLSGLWRLLLRLRFLYTLGLLTVLFTMVYLVFPSVRIRLRFCLWGGMAAATGWILFSWLFSFYVNRFFAKQALYGNLSLLLLTCVWLHICMLLLLYGGILSRLLEQNAYHPIRILQKGFFRS